MGEPHQGLGEVATSDDLKVLAWLLLRLGHFLACG